MYTHRIIPSTKTWHPWRPGSFVSVAYFSIPRAYSEPTSTPQTSISVSEPVGATFVSSQATEQRRAPGLDWAFPSDSCAWLCAQSKFQVSHALLINVLGKKNHHQTSFLISGTFWTLNWHPWTLSDLDGGFQNKGWQYLLFKPSLIRPWMSSLALQTPSSQGNRSWGFRSLLCNRCTNIVQSWWGTGSSLTGILCGGKRKLLFWSLEVILFLNNFILWYRRHRDTPRQKKTNRTWKKHTDRISIDLKPKSKLFHFILCWLSIFFSVPALLPW